MRSSSRSVRDRARPLAVLVTALAAGCSNPWYIHRFAPNPVESTAVLEDGGAGEVRSTVTFHGFRQPVPSEGQVAQAELSLRIENRSERGLWLDPDSIALSSVDPYTIGASPRIEPRPAPVPRGGVADYELVIPLQDGRTPWNYDLRRMTFSWVLDFGDEQVRQRVVFIQFDPIYDPSAEYPFPDDLLR
jgi:hypothetical protein